MLNEIRADAFTYDAASDRATIRAAGLTPHGDRACVGLFDAAGFLVGLDLRGDDPRGVIVMLGPHEAVASTRELRVHLERDRVVIGDARAAVRGDKKNPYM